MKIYIILVLAIFVSKVNAQHLFPVQLENCKAEKFCLDCGETKAGYDESRFNKLLKSLNKKLSLEGIQGAIKVQVLINSKETACVLSHTDESKSQISNTIVKELNNFKGWSAARTGEKKEEQTSITLLFLIKENKIEGQIERIDLTAFKKSFDRPNSPEIYNDNYKYENKNLPSYDITVWNSKNSNLSNNINDNISIDDDGIIWLTIDQGLVKFDGNEFSNAEQNITDKGKYFTYYEVATDNKNTKWISAKNNIYSFNNKNWTKYDSIDIGFDGAYSIINNKRTGELFFNTENGLNIYKNGNWERIDQNKFKDLPSNRIAYSKKDSKNRIWIGTYSGTVMIDSSNQLTNYEDSNSILKGKCITSMDEDKEGNLYFSLYELDRKVKGQVNNDEGIAILYADGTFKQFTTENSGMPFNHANCVLYDDKENVLWISTDRAGLVRFDLENEWENYHNENSEIPTSYISTMAFDKNNNLYLATRQGLVRIEKKY